ncbi:MAG: guanylate kinase [Acidimicrobiia bacterium]
MIAGPSGAGKGTVIRKLLEREPDLWFSVSYATRAPRPDEVEGVDYHFVDRADFLALRDADGFLEWFDVYGDLKGTPRAPVEEHLASGDDVLLEVDIQGALAVRAQYPEALLVFVKPPSRDEQRRRVLARPVEVPEDVEQRLAAAEAEEAHAARFDAVVVNDDVDAAVDQVAGILGARRSGR